tara:strand:+ start:54 stop:875 length:822 start_codon:yes stop_codon:yes gene_type:complete
MVVIGLGSAGCGIVDHFSSSHTKIKITQDDFPKSCTTEEQYEENCPNFFRGKNSRFRNSKFDECWFFLCGGSMCSSATLRILESIKDKRINIGYVFPDIDWASPQVITRHKVVFNILQEYARSGLLNKIVIFSNKNILNIVGDQPITVMYDAINRQIANTVESVLWFSSQSPVLGGTHKAKNISRIMTLSVGNFKENKEKLMFFLDNTTETSYIYSISKQKLESDKNLLNVIKKRIKNDEENNIISSFAIFASEHKQSFFYSLKYTHQIQPWE